jgi:multiple sugar transport system ATP-binding protein
MTVEQNMAFSLKLKASPRTEVEAKVGRAAGILGLQDLLRRYPKELSGGQRQRVAMGRALVRNPSVFLFDEPLSNLDAKLRVQMRGEIKSLHQRLSTTTVYVTHDQIEAMTMADQIVVMNNGRVEQIGAPLELYDRPVNLFVAGFIGSPAMNFLTGVVAENGFKTTEGLLLPLDPGLAMPVGSPAIYGVRPEHLALDAEGLPFEVELVEPTGSETQVQGKLGQQPLSGVFRERIDMKPGETLRVTPRPGAIHLFDAQSTQRIN